MKVCENYCDDWEQNSDGFMENIGWEITYCPWCPGKLIEEKKESMLAKWVSNQEKTKTFPYKLVETMKEIKERLEALEGK